MKIYKEESLSNFEFWSGARANAEQLTSEELDQLEQILIDTYGDEGLDEVYINDLMWFDFELICGWLGLDIDDDGNIIREDEDEDEEEDEQDEDE